MNFMRFIHKAMMAAALGAIMLANPEKNFVVIMKDGVIYKNALD